MRLLLSVACLSDVVIHWLPQHHQLEEVYWVSGLGPPTNVWPGGDEQHQAAVGRGVDRHSSFADQVSSCTEYAWTSLLAGGSSVKGACVIKPRTASCKVALAGTADAILLHGLR